VKDRDNQIQPIYLVCALVFLLLEDPNVIGTGSIGLVAWVVVVVLLPYEIGLYGGRGGVESGGEEV
jgi:hypothetical protein